ncbi:MAG: NADH-quinone oxidoreductase subunit NuoE [Anaerolineae bacterium]|nr:NADH-quinone oxidoreductase subunit NuoE [Anaerolineae bacterium]MBL6966380.1 NADH-quinone oxidoreductase subunit NuoE [Anaerolineales bacterium]
MEESLQTILSAYEGKQEEIIPILQKVQETYSYIPEYSMSDIARFTGVSESQVYGVATFYAQFRFTPRGKKHCMVCRGTACHVNGASRILEEIEEAIGIKEGETSADLEYSLETVACIGACSLAPAVMVNNTVEAKLDPKKVRKLFGREI